MEITADGSIEAQFIQLTRQVTRTVDVLEAADQLGGLTAGRDEVPQQLTALGAGQLVAHRVRHHRDTAIGTYPSHRLFHLGPVCLDVALLAGAQVTLEGILKITGQPRLHQRAREVGPRQGAVSRPAERGLLTGTLHGITQSQLLHARGDLVTAPLTCIMLLPEAGAQRVSGALGHQRHQVDGLIAPAHGQLAARQQGDAMGNRRLLSLEDAFHAVVIGQ